MTVIEPTSQSKPNEPALRPLVGPMTPYYFDAAKLLGAGNSTGLFGALVALYYFGDRGPTVLFWIKITGAAYLMGVCLFTIAFLFLFLSCLREYDVTVDPDPKAVERWVGYAILFSLLSFLVWWVGTILTVVVLVLVPAA